MIFVAEILDEQELAWLRGLYAELEAEEGARTAEGVLEQVKDNHQLVLGSRAGQIRARILDAGDRGQSLREPASDVGGALGRTSPRSRRTMYRPPPMMTAAPHSITGVGSSANSSHP